MYLLFNNELSTQTIFLVYVDFTEATVILQAPEWHNIKKDLPYPKDAIAIRGWKSKKAK